MGRITKGTPEEESLEETSENRTYRVQT